MKCKIVEERKKMISRKRQNVMAFMATMKVPNIHELPIELLPSGLGGHDVVFPSSHWLHNRKS